MKIKTGATDTGRGQPERQTAAHHQPSGDKRLFKIDQRTQKIFKVLFHSPHNPDLPGEVPRLEFLHAMVAIDFSAREGAWLSLELLPKNYRT